MHQRNSLSARPDFYNRCDCRILFNTSLFHRLPLCPKPFLPLVCQRCIAPLARIMRHFPRRHILFWTVIPFSRCVRAAYRQPAQTRRSGGPGPMGGSVEMRLNLRRIFSGTAQPGQNSVHPGQVFLMGQNCLCFRRYAAAMSRNIPLVGCWDRRVPAISSRKALSPRIQQL